VNVWPRTGVGQVKGVVLFQLKQEWVREWNGVIAKVVFPVTSNLLEVTGMGTPIIIGRFLVKVDAQMRLIEFPGKCCGHY
jgi:hypothetical protein